MKNELFNYLKSFLMENSIEEEWMNEHTLKQARAIFTTMCLVGYIDADTAECDNILLSLYNETIGENVMSYDEFEMFMIELIV